jgi:hypothetical protein
MLSKLLVLRNHYEGYRLCPADSRIQAFLDAYLSDIMPDSASLAGQHCRAGSARFSSRDVPPTGPRHPRIAGFAVVPRGPGDSSQPKERPSHSSRCLSYCRRGVSRFLPTRPRFPSARLPRCCPQPRLRHRMSWPCRLWRIKRNRSDS